jgi:glutamate carboxypeptidase
MISDSELEELRACVQVSEPSFVADLERLVNIDCGSYTKSGVDQVGAWVSDQLRDLGADVTVEPHADLGKTVVAVLRGAGSQKALLVGHMDTVFDPGTAAERPYTVTEGIARGPGVDDMKGGLLAGIYALRALRAMATSAGSGAEWLPFDTLTFVANPDEELGSPSSLPIIKRIAETVDVAFVLEAARENGDIVSARKGIADFVMKISGRAAHAGVEPEKGRNAILEAAHKIVALNALNGRWPGVTVNVGVMRGGMRPNVIAESAELEIDLRGVTRADMEAAQDAIREIAEHSSVPDVTASLRSRASWWPMEKTAGTAALAAMAIELGARLGFTVADTSTGGASDANTTSAAGAPSLDGLGPVGGNAHAPTEYMELDSIVPRTTLLAALLLSVSRQPSLRERSAGS